jgi:hypothetical protein
MAPAMSLCRAMCSLTQHGLRRPDKLDLNTYSLFCPPPRWGLTRVVFFRHDTAPGAVLPLPPEEGKKNLPQKARWWVGLKPFLPPPAGKDAKDAKSPSVSHPREKEDDPFLWLHGGSPGAYAPDG